MRAWRRRHDVLLCARNHLGGSAGPATGARCGMKGLMEKMLAVSRNALLVCETGDLFKLLLLVISTVEGDGDLPLAADKWCAAGRRGGARAF